MTQQMKIQVVNVDVGNAKTKKGQDYKFLDVMFKNLTFEGKAESKKVMPFGSKEVFATLETSQKGDVFTVLREKDNDGYWQWIGIAEGDTKIETTNAPQAAAKAPTSAPNTTPKSTYETAEERAKKQVYIVRQSSISAAIETLKTDKKSPSVEEVLAVAKQYEDYVFGNLEVPKAATAKLPELDDDIPM
jgi:hypothetical protein